MLFSGWCRQLTGRLKSTQLSHQRHARLVLSCSLTLLALLVWGLCSLAKKPVRSCLVLYSWNVTNPTHTENFEYFLKEGLINQPGVHFWIVLHSNEHGQLPALPSHAKYVHLHRPCQAWGALSRLAKGHRRLPRYGYYITVDSAVQGPFMAPYAKRAGTWIDGLLDRIDDQVKLAGSAISCDIAVLPDKLDDEESWRINPHVDAHVMATDRVGLQVLMSHPDVIQCYDDPDKAAYYVEAGGSLAILENGYSLDSLMLRYQGLDWRERQHWDCNGRISPLKPHYYDGVSLDPFEVMFVKMELPDRSRTSYTFNAVQAYKRWLQDGHDSSTALSVNHVLEHPMQHKLGHVCHLLTRTSACFDFLYYRMRHSDLASIADPQMLWVHFLFYGQFEERAHRFNCTAVHWAALEM